MKILTIIFSSLFCASLFASSTEATQFLIEKTEQQIEVSDHSAINKIKQGYSDQLQYAIYVATASFLCHIVGSRHLPTEKKFLFLVITSLSSIWGFSNMIKWLFVQLNPNSKNTDIEFLNKSESLMFIILFLYIQEKHKLQQLLYNIRSS